MDTIAHPDSVSVLRLIDDWDAYNALPGDCRKDIVQKLSWVRAVSSAPRGRKTALIAALAAEHRVSPATISRVLTAYQRGGWRALRDLRRWPPRDAATSYQFRKFVAGLYRHHQRDDEGAEVHRVLLDRLSLWRATGDPDHRIPGYETPPPNAKNGHPRGWSQRNIHRLRPRSKYGAALAKQGTKDASKYLLPVLNTRVGSRFAQVYFFDDQDMDRKVIAGLSQTARPVGFNCLEYLSGAHVDYHLRLLHHDDEEDRKKTLTQREFTWLVIRVLQTVGYRTDEVGTTLIFEHKTADAFRNQALTTFSGHHSFDDAIHAFTDGHVSVARSGLFNKEAFAGMIYKPQSSGNFRRKAPIESAFRLVRTYDQLLDGQTGRRYDLAPEELYGLEKEEAQLARALANMPAFPQDLLRRQLLTFVECAELYRAIYRAINDRRWHALEGWDRIPGFTAPVWRWTTDTDQWWPQAELHRLQADDPQQHQHLLARLAADPDLTKVERLSPREVVDVCLAQDSRNLRTLPPWAIPLIVPREWAQLRKVADNHTIKIREPLSGTKDYLVFPAIVRTPQGDLHLPTGQQVLCYLSPLDDHNMVVCEQDGTYLGQLRRIVRTNPADVQGVIRQLGERSRHQAAVRADEAEHYATIIEKRQADARHNRTLIDDHQTPPEEKKAARARTGAQGRVERPTPDRPGTSRTGATPLDL